MERADLTSNADLLELSGLEDEKALAARSSVFYFTTRTAQSANSTRPLDTLPISLLEDDAFPRRPVTIRSTEIFSAYLSIPSKAVRAPTNISLN